MLLSFSRFVRYLKIRLFTLSGRAGGCRYAKTITIQEARRVSPSLFAAVPVAHSPLFVPVSDRPLRVLFLFGATAFYPKPDACRRGFSIYRGNTVLCHFAGTVWGRQSAALRRSGSPTPSLFTRTPIARELLPAGAGSFYLLKLCSHVPDCYGAPLPIGTP